MKTTKKLEFHLISAWIPIKGKKTRLNDRKFKKIMNTFWGVDIVEWEQKDKDFGNIHSLHKLAGPGMKNKYLMISDSNQSQLDRKTGSMVNVKRDYTALTSFTYGDYLICLGWNTAAQIVRLSDHRVIWQCKEIYCYRDDQIAHWCSYNQMAQLCRHVLCYISHDDRKLVKIDVKALIPKIELGGDTDSCYEILDEDVVDLCMDRNPAEVYWITKDDRIVKNSVKMLMDDNFEQVANKLRNSGLHLNNICKRDRYLILGFTNRYKLESYCRLYSLSGKYLDHCRSKGRTSRIQIFTAFRIDMAIIGCEQSAVFILAIHKGRFYPLTDYLNIMTTGENKICNIITNLNPEKEIIVLGNKIVSLKILLSPPIRPPKKQSKFCTLI